MILRCIKLLKKKEFDRHYSDLYWPTAIKDTIRWFPFLTIMEHTANVIKSNKGLIPPLLKVFAMFELRLVGYGDKVDAIAIRCIYSKKETILYLRN